MVIDRACITQGSAPELIAGPPAAPRLHDELRREALAVLPPRPRPILPQTAGQTPPDIADTRGWSDEDLWNAIEKLKDGDLGWKETTGSARKWWEAFETENNHRPALIHRLAEELRNRKATIGEFFLAYVYSNTDNIQANLHYLDYQRLKDGEPKKSG